MPPKKPAATADPPAPSSSDAPVGKDAETNPDVHSLRKLAAHHPSTAIMMKQALKELDSRKGVSSQAIQNYIKQKYPSVDVLRLKHLVRRALKKGLENGTLIRPASSSVATGAVGKFRLAPKVKEPKQKTENTDPNLQEAPEPAKDGAKKPKKAGVTKKKDPATDQTKSQEDPKPPKKSKEKDAVTSKVAPAKKPKVKTAGEKGDGKSNSGSTKTTTKEKAGKESQSKAAKDDVSKTTGKRGKKAKE